MDLELRHLRAFLAVADELHFGHAAARLGTAQSALSQQIQRMERNLGFPLLHRTSRQVELTAAGAALAERARSLLAQAERDVEEARRVAEGAQGRLDVGFVSSAVFLGAVDSVARFSHAHPRVDVVLHEGFTEPLMSGVERGGLDVATVRDPDPRPDGRLRLVPLLSEPLVAIIPSEHRSATRGGDVDGAELAGGPLVLFPRTAGETAYRLAVQPLGLGPGRAPRVVQEASHWTTILHLVATGLGITVAPQSVASAAPPGVRVLTLRGPEVRSTLYLATRTGDDRPALRRFLDIASPGRGPDAADRPTGP